jgi:uncharacterized protein YbaR (Trm112 family)
MHDYLNRDPRPMTPPIDPALLDLLRCPETQQTLSEAPADLIDAINRRIQAGQVVTRSGQTVSEPIDGGLLRQDGAVLYPVRDDIPILLVEEALKPVTD